MSKSNYKILSVPEGANQKEIRRAFRRLALRYHSDRGGDEERFKEIKQAYDDLRVGLIRQSKSLHFEDDSEESIQKNTALAREIAQHMRVAEAWVLGLVSAGQTGTRLFGSTTLGEIELERKANGILSIKGNIMAGRLNYSGSIAMRGTITSPTRGAESTEIVTLVGNLEILDAVKNRYRIENGARIIAKNGNITVGNIFGKKRRINDSIRAGVYTIKEYRTLVEAPNGTVRIINATNTVEIRALVVEIVNAKDDVRIIARDIIVRGSTLTHNVEFHILKNGSIRFLETRSILALSDDAMVILENGKSFSLHELKVKKIRDLNIDDASGNQTLVGNGFVITYDMLDSFYDNPISLRKSFGRLILKRS